MKSFCIVVLAALAHWLAQQALLGLAQALAFGRLVLETIVGLGGFVPLHFSFERRLARVLDVFTNPVRSLAPASMWQSDWASVVLLALNSLFWGACLGGLVLATAKAARRYGFLPGRESGLRALPFSVLKLHDLLRDNNVFVPVLTLAFASAVSVGLVVARMVW